MARERRPMTQIADLHQSEDQTTNQPTRRSSQGMFAFAFSLRGVREHVTKIEPPQTQGRGPSSHICRPQAHGTTMDLRDQLATCQGAGLRSLYGLGIQKAGHAIYVSVCKGSLSEGVLGPPPLRMPFLGTRTPGVLGCCGLEWR
jgi:hypothetical protein